ncbi:MAG: hypothetical protein ACREPE_11835 [Lysobacter sp.]
MNRSIFVAGIALLFSRSAIADCSHGRLEEKLGSQVAPFQISYNDGSDENILIRYTAFASRNVSQTGESSSWKHPIDNRECHWTTEAYVLREVCVVSRSLGEQCDGTDTKVFNVAAGGKGDGVNLLKLEVQGENCNDMCPRFNADYNAAKQAANAHLNGVFDQDVKPYVSEVRKRDGVASIKEQQP